MMSNEELMARMDERLKTLTEDVQEIKERTMKYDDSHSEFLLLRASVKSLHKRLDDINLELKTVKDKTINNSFFVKNASHFGWLVVVALLGTFSLFIKEQS